MTIYEWLITKDNIIVSFDKFIDEDRTEVLKIQMDIGCGCSVIANSDNTLTFFPITTTRTFYDNQIPDNDAAMSDVLNQMHQDLINIFNNIKYKNK